MFLDVEKEKDHKGGKKRGTYRFSGGGFWASQESGGG